MSNMDRREFLRLVGAGSVGAGVGFMLEQSNRHPLEHLIPSVVPPEDFSPGIATWYNTACSMCSAGCGISVRTREGRAKKIEGNPSHPVSQGRLCALGQAGLQVLYNPDRLTAPLLRTVGRALQSSDIEPPQPSSLDSTSAFEPITWEGGLAKVTERLGQLRDSGQGSRICLLSQGVRGHLANVFELFMQQLGSDRLLHYDFDHPHTLYAANKRFFGEESLPYYDLKNTRYLLSFGADYLGNWLSPVHYGLGYGDSRQGGQGRGRFVQIEPRMSLSGAAADEWIAAKPGTEGLLALALAHHLVTKDYYRGADRDDWAASLEKYSSVQVAAQTGVPVATISRLADSFANTQPSLAIGGGSAGNHSNGVDTLVAVNALNYLVGNLGKSGGLVFNPPPAVGQLSHYRQASYDKLLEFTEDARHGRIEVLIVNSANPVFTLPAVAGFKEALAHIPLIVSLSSFMDETTALADIILPSHSSLESWGDDFPEPGVGFPVGTISQPVVSPLYNTRPTGDIILDMAKQLGFAAALPWSTMKDCLREGWRGIYQRDGDHSEEGFESFWRAVLKSGVWGQKAARAPDALATASSSAEISAPRPALIDKKIIDSIHVDAPEFSGTSETYPFILYPYLSNALRDGRGANLPWLQELPDPLTSVVYGTWLEVNPTTAKRLGLVEGDLVEVESPHGQIAAPVYLYPAIMPEVVAMPIGQGHSDYGRYAKNRGANPLQILAPLTEQHTGSLAWSATRVRISATGGKVPLVKTGGHSHELGREIIQTIPSASVTSTGASDDAKHSQGLQLISLKEITT